MIKSNSQQPNLNLMLPKELIEALQKFVVDRSTGNIKINVKDGQIKGFHVESITAVK